MDRIARLHALAGALLSLATCSGASVVPLNVTLMPQRGNGFRMVTTLNGRPVLVDTGSSTTALCPGAPLPPDARALGVYACDGFGSGAYGFEGAFYAANVTLGGASMGVAPGASGGNPHKGAGSVEWAPGVRSGPGEPAPETVLPRANLVAITDAVGLSPSNFCEPPLQGILGVAGAKLNTYVAKVQGSDAFPACESARQAGALPTSLLRRASRFALFVNRTTMRGAMLLGSSVGLLTSRLARVGTTRLLPTHDTFFKVQVAKYVFRGFTLAHPGKNGELPHAILDTGTETMVVPSGLLQAFARAGLNAAEPSAPNQTLLLKVSLPEAGRARNFHLALDLNLYYQLNLPQEASSKIGMFAEGSGASVLGLPLWFFYATVFDLDAKTVAFYLV